MKHSEHGCKLHLRRMNPNKFGPMTLMKWKINVDKFATVICSRNAENQFSNRWPQKIKTKKVKNQKN